jgi:hypothetical protein
LPKFRRVAERLAMAALTVEFSTFEVLPPGVGFVTTTA